MTYKKGRQQYLAYSKESTRLTAMTTGFNPLFWNSLKAEGNKNQYRQDDSAFGRRSSIDSTPLISQHAELSFGDVIDADQLLMPMAGVLGTATPTTALGATTWNLSVLQALEVPTFTMQYNNADNGHKRIKGSVVSKLELEITADGDCTFNCEMAGIVEEAGTTITPTYTTRTKKLLGRDTTLGYATTQANLTSATLLNDVRRIKITLDSGNQIERNKVLGSLTPTENLADGFKASLEFDLILANSQAVTVQGWHDNATELAFRIDVNATRLPVIGTSALKPRLTIDTPPSNVEVMKEIPVGEYLLQKCKVELNNADLITAVLINAISTL